MCIARLKIHDVVLVMPQGLSLTATMQVQRDAARRIKLLVAVQNELNWTAREWCLKAGVSANTLYNFYHGRAHTLHIRTLEKLARAANVPISRLTGDTDLPRIPAPEVRIIGSVEASIWRESAQWPDTGGEILLVPIPREYREVAFAVRVDGPSMNKLFPASSYVICTPLEDFSRELQSGDCVVVRRRSADGHYEFTLKEIVFEDNMRPWLWPRSDHPEYQTPIEIPWPMVEQDNDSEIAVIAIVIGSYRPQPL